MMEINVQLAMDLISAVATFFCATYTLCHKSLKRAGQAGGNDHMRIGW